jgi:hypothetical protein
VRWDVVHQLSHDRLVTANDDGNYVNKSPDGAYVLEIEATDVRGNPRTGTLAVTFINGT